MKTKIIAEIASCHNGDIELAKKMVQEAAKAGVDYVKFQSWQAKNVADDDPDKKRYESLELSDEDHKILIEECEKNGVQFMTTIFNIERIPFVKSLGVNTVKVASMDCKHPKLLNALKENFKTVIISTGMTYPEEVEVAAEAMRGSNFALLHCVSIYPCPTEKANLARMDWLKTLAPQWGLSDHTQGPEAAMHAISTGADFVEKHFTLDKNTEQMTHTVTPGKKAITTHEIANEPEVFKKICEWRDLVDAMRGTGQKEPFEEELPTRKKYTNRLGKNA